MESRLIFKYQNICIVTQKEFDVIKIQCLLSFLINNRMKQ